MASSLTHVLHQWHEQKDQTEWVLCTIFATEGSSYRKAGAMMMFSGLGHQYGLLSGGCLESDMLRHARDVMYSQQSKTLTYDASDEDDLTFQLGIGCGGVVHILLQPVSEANQYLGLENLYDALCSRQCGIYQQVIPPAKRQGEPFGAFELTTTLLPGKAELVERDGRQSIHINITPDPHLLIAGGGYDARPLAIMAKSLGWKVTVWDPRPANARKAFFPDVDCILRNEASQLTEYCHTQQVSAAILMAHSVSIDAQVLQAVVNVMQLNPSLCSQYAGLQYVGLLGPVHRKREVLQQANVNEPALSVPLASPIGLDLGGDTPESIALAVLAEIHAVKQGKSARSLSNMLQ